MDVHANPFFILEAESFGLVSSVGLNGVPLLMQRDGGRLKSIRPYNQWIRPGTNTLHIFANWPPDDEFQEGIAGMDARVFIPPPGQDGMPEPGLVLAKLAWPIDAIPEVYPQRLEAPFEVEPDLAPPVRVWSEAEKLSELRTEDHEEMVRQVNALAADLLKGDAGSAYRFVAYKHAEEERAEYKPEGRFRDVVVRQFEMIAREGGLQYDPLTTKNSSARLFADGQIALLERDPSAEALVITAGPKRFRIATYFSKINGKWMITR